MLTQILQSLGFKRRAVKQKHLRLVRPLRRTNESGSLPMMNLVTPLGLQNFDFKKACENPNFIEQLRLVLRAPL